MLKLVCFHFIQCLFTVGHWERDPSALCVLQHFPILIVNMGTILTQHPIGHRVVIYPWLFLFPVWLELQLFSRNGTFAARNLSSLCIFWQCSWWNFRSGQLWLCGIHIITEFWPIIANILPLLAVRWCGYRVIFCKPGYFPDSSSIRRVRQCMFHILISMDDWRWMRACMILEVHWLAYIDHLPTFWDSPGLDGFIVGVGGGSLGSHKTFPSYPSFFTLLSIKTIQDHQLNGDYTKNWGKNIWWLWVLLTFFIIALFEDNFMLKLFLDHVLYNNIKS